MWVRFTVSHVIWDIAALLISSLVVHPCYSWSSSSFSCPSVSSHFSTQTWNAPGKCCVCQGSLSLQSPIQNSKQEFWMPFGISDLAVWTQKIQVILMHLVWLPNIMRFRFSSLLLQLRNWLESATEIGFKWCTKRHIFIVCLSLESMGQLMEGEDVLVERLMQNVGEFSSQMYHRHSLSPWDGHYRHSSRAGGNTSWG